MKKFTKTERDWILYDVGNSAYILMVTTVIPILFKALAKAANISEANSTAYWAYALTFSTIAVAILGPTLGRLADQKGKKRKFFMGFVLVGIVSVFILGFINMWQAFLAVFIVSKIGYSTSLVFYDSMLVDVTEAKNSDRVSTNGFAWGYIGSCIPFVIIIAFLQLYGNFNIGDQLAYIIVFVLVGLWWLAFTLPLFKNYQQKHYRENDNESIGQLFIELKKTFQKIKLDRPIFLFMIAYFLYIDAVATIITMSTAYGTDVGINATQMLLALLLTQIIAFPAAILFGRFSVKFPTRKLIEICIIGYTLIVLFAFQLDKAWEFWVLAVAVACFQGAIQALSRSYFSRLVPKENSNEYFGFFDIFGKGAAAFGTFMMAVVTQMTGSSRFGVLGLLIMLIAGYVVMLKIPHNPADVKD